MAHRIFFISDTHFGHANILNFKTSEGHPLRPFTTCEEMDEHIVECWNKTVRPCDKIYHLGDVVINRKSLSILSRLNGHKRLVRGNHDIFKTKEYMEYFEEIYGVRVFSKEGIICSHIPLDYESLESRNWFNVHGHLHSNVKHHPNYLNISVEQINYTPIEMDEIMVIKQLRGVTYNATKKDTSPT